MRAKPQFLQTKSLVMPQGTMKAVVIVKPGEPLELRDVPIPKPGPRDLLVKVTAASLCHSDFAAIFAEDVPFTLKKDLIPGHEACGIVVEAGPEAAKFGFAKGDRVGADAGANMCLKCFDCTDFGPQFCKTKDFRGFTADGFFSEYALFDAATAVKVPGEGNMSEVAPILCAGITVWDALTRAAKDRLKKGDWVGIVGCGGLGHMAIQYANSMGYKTLAVDVKDKQLEFAKSVGATATLNSRSVKNVKEEVDRITGTHGVQVALTTSGIGAAYATAFEITRSHGRIVAIGLARGHLPLTADHFVLDCKEMVGTLAPGQKDIKECVDYSFKHKIFGHVIERKLEDFNELVDNMKNDRVTGRQVVVFE